MTASPEQTTTALQRLRSRLPFAILGGVLFIVFLFLRISEAKIHNLVTGYAQYFLQPMGYSFQAKRATLGLWPKPGLKIYDVSLQRLGDPSSTTKVDFVRIAPNYLSLLPGRAVRSASFLLESEKSYASGEIGLGPSGLNLEMKLSQLDLKKLPLLNSFGGFKLESGFIDGELKLDYDSLQPQQTQGSISLEARQFVAPPQALMGMQLPKLNLSVARLVVPIQKGKADLKQVELGKDLKRDDVLAQITGEVALSEPLSFSRLNNVKVLLQLSPAVQKAIPLLDSLLGSAKTPDGKYSIRLNGSIGAPEPAFGGAF